VDEEKAHLQAETIKDLTDYCHEINKADHNKMDALAQENIWMNKAQCEEAERLQYEKLSRTKDTLSATSQLQESSVPYHNNKMVALAQENIWLNKAQCEEAEQLYNEKLSRSKDRVLMMSAGDPEDSLSRQSKRAYQYIQNSFEFVDGLICNLSEEALAVALAARPMEIENKHLKKITEDLKSLIIKLENCVVVLESGKGVASTAGGALTDKKEEEDEEKKEEEE
jgi:hypothetical protein